MNNKSQLLNVKWEVGVSFLEKATSFNEKMWNWWE